MSGRPPKNQSVYDLIETFVVKDDETNCWNWQGGKHNQNYNMCRFDGKMHRTERLFKSEIESLSLTRNDRVSNTCGNADCVNPDHYVIKWEGQYVNEYGQRPSKFSQQEYEELMKEYWDEDNYPGKQSRFCEKYNINPNMMSKMKNGTYRTTR